MYQFEIAEEKSLYDACTNRELQLMDRSDRHNTWVNHTIKVIVRFSEYCERKMEISMRHTPSSSVIKFSIYICQLRYYAEYSSSQ